tara:strand:+ start:20133 stop:21677 length:1545 start_codon:yes stop_codon:yes gene_type:complete
MRRIFIFTLFALLLAGVNKAVAQNPNNSLLYSYQAVLFGDQGSAYDPISIIMPGTAFKSGFGSFIDNPASLALQKNGFAEFGLSIRNIEENTSYLGQAATIDNQNNNFSNVGFLYSFPTVQGSFVIGAGYTQHTVFDRVMNFQARNNNSTITDEFKAEGSPYQEIAFDTFATDYGDEFEDWDESIFRIGFFNFGDFLGIRQQGEIFQTGYNGEYSAFFATEFQENFMVGASLGVLSGRFKYSRIFQEIDEFNDYDSPDFIDSSGDGSGDTDIDRITLDDQLESRFTGFRARIGTLYRVNNSVSVGASYAFPTTIEVDEIFNAEIITDFDNGNEFSAFTDSEFSYSLKYPSRLSLGLGLNDIAGFSVSLSTEFTDYASTEIEFQESSLFEDELIENDFISDSYRSVWNMRAGVSYEFSKDLTLRAGYSYLPSKFLDGSDDRNVYAAGAGFSISNDIRFEIAAQYTQWEETSVVYDYAQYNYSVLPDSPPNVSFRSEVANRTVDRLNLLGTVRFKF